MGHLPSSVPGSLPGLSCCGTFLADPSLLTDLSTTFSRSSRVSASRGSPLRQGQRESKASLPVSPRGVLCCHDACVSLPRDGGPFLYSASQTAHRVLARSAVTFSTPHLFHIPTSSAFSRGGGRAWFASVWVDPVQSLHRAEEERNVLSPRLLNPSFRGLVIHCIPYREIKQGCL